jgi:hypothetical protein
MEVVVKIKENVKGPEQFIAAANSYQYMALIYVLNPSAQYMNLILFLLYIFSCLWCVLGST